MLVVLLLIAVAIVLVAVFVGGWGGSAPTVVRRTIVRRPVRTVVEQPVVTRQVVEEPVVQRRVYDDRTL